MNPDNNKNTLADIVAGIRGSAERARECEDFVLAHDFDNIADRIEAAAKRETAAGDTVKMREALEHISKATFVDCSGKRRAELEPETVALVDAALAAPPRNCDVGTAKEQEERFGKFCSRLRGGTCLRCTVPPVKRECALSWAQLPYESAQGRNNRAD